MREARRKVDGIRRGSAAAEGSGGQVEEARRAAVRKKLRLTLAEPIRWLEETMAGLDRLAGRARGFKSSNRF